MNPTEVRETDVKEIEHRAWVRGFFSALAYHSEGTDRREGILSTGLLTAKDALAAGAEAQDVARMQLDFASVASKYADRGKRRATCTQRGTP